MSEESSSLKIIMIKLLENVMKPFFRSASMQSNEVYGFFKLLVTSVNDPILNEEKKLKDLLKFTWLLCGFLKPFEEQNDMEPEMATHFLPNPNPPPPIRISYKEFKNLLEAQKNTTTTTTNINEELIKNTLVEQYNYIFDEYEELIDSFNLPEGVIKDVKRCLVNSGEFDREKYTLWCEILINIPLLKAFIDELHLGALYFMEPSNKKKLKIKGITLKF